jgi:hypothetical protein
MFPKFSREHRLWGFTDFNDLASENPEMISVQLKDALKEHEQVKRDLEP